jgi:pimeloyl-ACP methyl ester carboxylesterase
MMGIIVLLVAGLIVLYWGVRRIEPHLAFFPFAGEDATPLQSGVAYTALTIETSDGERLHAWHLPRADAVGQVVYFHGNGGNLSIWLPILAGVQASGLNVLAFDYRGYGRSTGSPTEKGL